MAAVCPAERKEVMRRGSLARTGHSASSLTCYALLVVAGLVHLPHEELQADDSIDDDDKQHEKGDMQQRDHGLDDGIQNHLETYKGKSP